MAKLLTQLALQWQICLDFYKQKKKKKKNIVILDIKKLILLKGNKFFALIIFNCVFLKYRDLRIIILICIKDKDLFIKL